MDEVQWAQQFRPDGPASAADVLARRLVTPDRAELEQAMVERAAEAKAEERRENLRLENYAKGDPLGHVGRAQVAVGAARETVRDLETQLEKAREVLQRAESNMGHWAREADQVLFARRSVTPDLLAEAKRAAAEVKVEAMLARAAASPPKECRGPGCEVCSAARALERGEGRDVVVNRHPAVKWQAAASYPEEVFR